MQFECNNYEPTTNPHYVKFVKEATSFFGVKRYMIRSFPEWDPMERKLESIKLPNGMNVDIDLAFDNPNRPFSLTAIYPEGGRQQPASHFIEHMLCRPQGLKDEVFEMVAQPEGIQISGTTYREKTDFGVEVQPIALRHLHGMQLRPFSSLAGLLYGMTVLPEISEEVMRRERARITAELAGNRDSVERRMADYVYPLIAGGLSYAQPGLEAQTNYNMDQLNAAHRERPHAQMRFEVKGNPQSRDAIPQIMNGLSDTFGRLGEVNIDPTQIQQKQPESGKLFADGTKIRVKAKFDQASNYVGMMSVVDLVDDPYRSMSRKVFDMMNNIFGYLRLHTEGYAYHRPIIQLPFPSERRSLNLTAGNTTDSEASANSLFKSLDTTTGRKSDEVRNMFDAARFSLSNRLFREVNFARLEASRELRLPTDNNCSALYYLLRNLEFDDVIEEGRKMVDQNAIGFIHYASPNVPTIEGFTAIEEDELLARASLIQPYRPAK